LTTSPVIVRMSNGPSPRTNVFPGGMFVVLTT